MSSCGCGNTPKSDAKGDVSAVGSAMPTGVKDLLTAGSSELVECRVMPGSVIEKVRAEAEGLFRDFEGNRYWFCCKGCGPRFDANPRKYADVS